MGDFVSALLSFAHQLFGPGVCFGDWVWATSTAGALIALVPVLGAVLLGLVRKGTGNRYSGPTLVVVAAIGIVFVLVIPWLLINGVSGSFRSAFAGVESGLSTAELKTLNTDYCSFIGNQKTYLGGGQNVYETLFYPSGNKLAYGYYLGALLLLPGLSLLFIMLQARKALRRGPLWPARFFWISFVLLFLFSIGVSANTAVHLWLGFLPVSVLGLIPVTLIGPPMWSTISRSEKDPESRESPPELPPAPASPPKPVEPYRPTALITEPPMELAADPGPMPTPPGSTAVSSGRYRRVRRLGHGGFGTVWEAVDNQLGRTVALKIAHAPDRDTRQRMEREARALAAVNHPNCVRVYDLIEEPDGLALVMEYLEGQELTHAVDTQGPLDDVAAGRLWVTMAGALSAAHEKGVLHRDLKPSNVILDPQGLAHLIDFGIARSKGDSTLTATGMMVGTPDYVAPETAAGAPASPASDAWQLAATVSYALSGYPPRGTRETPMAALLAAARAEPASRLPQRTAHHRLLRAALDNDPSQRPTLRVIQREVEAWLLRAGKSPDGPVTRVIRPVSAPARAGEPPANRQPLRPYREELPRGR